MFTKVGNFLFNRFEGLYYHPFFNRNVPLRIKQWYAHKLFTLKIHRQPLPDSVRLEASTICQLRCRSCSIQVKDSDNLGRGFLSYDNFKRFCEDNRFVKKIELSNFGEIFLNPDLIQMIKYAFEHKISLTASNGTNFNTVSDEVLKTMVKYNFKYLKVSIDGASQETYSQYRINGNFDTVIENIKRLNYYKSKYNSTFPALLWQFVLMQHNEDDVILAKKMAKELNMSIIFITTWDNDYIPQKREMLTKETGLQFLTTQEKSRNSTNKAWELTACQQLWTEPQINWDGRLLGCCYVAYQDFGVNVFEVGLEKALNSENYRYAKDMLQGKVPPPENTANIPCADCGHYKLMCKTGNYFTL
jgi:MoaA/NifB/PqqE/SkfB family radical SAM enzyme